MSAVVANRIGDIEGKVIASFPACHAKQLPVLIPAEMFLQIHVQSRASGQMFDVFPSMQAKFVDNIQFFIFNDVEITVVAIARYFVAGFPVPFCVFNAYIFGRNHFAVEHDFFCPVFLIVPFDKSEYFPDKILIFGIIAYFYS